MVPPSIRVNLSVEVDVFTAGSAAEVVNAILESLLYQRNQIPFVYKTYRYYVNKWLDDEKNQQKSIEEDHAGVRSFQLQRQRDKAKMTKNAIGAMREAISEAIERQSIRCFRFLFGATAFTPKEAYTIHIPPDVISVNHCYDHHRMSPAKLNQTLLSLLTNEELYAIFSNNLNPTNVYLELEAFELPSLSQVESAPSSLTFPKEYFPLPASCKDIQLHLFPKCNDEYDDQHLKCCKELKVFEDIRNLNIENVVDSSTDSKANATRVSNGQTVWWESEVVVRGFKDQPIKGANLWS